MKTTAFCTLLCSVFLYPTHSQISLLSRNSARTLPNTSLQPVAFLEFFLLPPSLQPDNYTSSWTLPSGETVTMDAQSNDSRILLQESLFPVNTTLHLQTAYLIVQSLSYLDAGNYTCRIQDNTVSGPRFVEGTFELRLLLTLAPIEPSVMTLDNASSVEMSCEMSDFIRPDNQLQWIKDGQLIVSGQNRRIITFTNGTRDGQIGGSRIGPSRLSTLTISNPVLSDSGTYTCRVLAANESVDIQLQVQNTNTLTTRPGPVETVPPLSTATIPSTPPVNDNLGLTLGLAIGLSVLALLVTIVFITSIIICVKQKRRKRLEIINVLPIPTLPPRSPGICPSSISVEAMGIINRSPILRTDFELIENLAYESKPEMTGNEVEDNESAIYEDIDEVIPQYLESTFNPLTRPFYPLQEQACRCEESAVNMGSSPQEIGMNENEAYERKPGNETTDYDIIPVCEDEAEVNPVFAFRNHPSQSTTHKVTIPNHSPSQEV